MLYLILAICASASMALVLKCFREQTGNRYGILLGNYLTCILISVILLPDKSQLLHGSRATLLCGLAGGVFFVSALICMQASIRQNGAGLTSAFARLGLLVSLAVSILLFGDRPTAPQFGGIALALVALILLRPTQKDALGKRRALLRFGLLLLTLLASGGADVMAKVFEQYGPETESSLYFFFVFSTSALVCSLLGWLEWKKHGKAFQKKEFAAGILVGIPNFLSSYLLLLALQHLPALLTYPVFSVATILLVMLLSAILFRERLTKKQLPGILCILAAIALLNL